MVSRMQILSYNKYDKFEAFKEALVGEEEQDFVVLWNSRNIRRKNASDIILAWRLFLDQLPDTKIKYV